MREAKFKVGDVVQLNSGSPKMTVNGIEFKDQRCIIHTVWFKGHKLKEAEIIEELLEHEKELKRPNLIYSPIEKPKTTVSSKAFKPTSFYEDFLSLFKF